MKLILILIFAFLPVSTFAITYDEALKIGLESSHDLKILKLQSESAQQSQKKAIAGFLPTLELSGRHLFDERFEELEVPFANDIFVMPAIQPYTNAGVTLEWNLFNGFKDKYEWDAARAEKSAAETALNRAKEEKRVQIRSLFSRALASQILVDVSEKNISSLQSHLDDVTVRIRSGVATRYDSLRTEVQLEEARTEKLAAENAVLSTRAKLFEALGVADDGKPLQGELMTDFTKINPKEIASKINERADRASLISQRDRAESLSKASRSHFMPQVSLIGNYEFYNNINHSITDADERFKSSYAVGAKLSWNLFDGGADSADYKKTILAKKIAEENLAKFDESSHVQATEIQNKFSFDLVNYNAKMSSVRKAEEAVRLANGGLKAGTRTNTEILDAVVELNRARAAAVKSQVEAIEDMGQLELAFGITL
jgi:outer membrane protein TolC